MYLNNSRRTRNGKIYTRLTVTYDVFKSTDVNITGQLNAGLTVTYDVFK